MADTIRTEADLLNNIFPDNQAPGSITAQDMRDLVASTRYLQPLGWEFRFDSQYTSGSPRALVDSTPEKVTFTDNPGEDLRYPSTFPDLWDGVNQKMALNSSFSNGFGIVRLSCLGSYTGGTVPHVDLWMDVGSDPIVGGTLPNDPGTPSTGTASNVIYTSSLPFAKGAGEVMAFNWIIPLFAGSDFVTNGAQFIVQAHEANCNAWQFTMTSGAILIPNPAGES